MLSCMIDLRVKLTHIDLHAKLTQIEKLEALLVVAKEEHARQASKHKSLFHTKCF